MWQFYMWCDFSDKLDICTHTHVYIYIQLILHCLFPFRKCMLNTYRTNQSPYRLGLDHFFLYSCWILEFLHCYNEAKVKFVLHTWQYNMNLNTMQLLIKKGLTMLHFKVTFYIGVLSLSWYIVVLCFRSKLDLILKYVTYIDLISSIAISI